MKHSSWPRAARQYNPLRPLVVSRSVHRLGSHPRLGLGWRGSQTGILSDGVGLVGVWLKKKINTRVAPGAASSVVSLAALPCRLVSADHRIYVSLPGWLLAAFRSPDVKRNHRARAFSCCHVFWIGAAVSTCMIKPCGFKFLFFSEMVSRFNSIGLLRRSIDRQWRVDTTYDGPMARVLLIMVAGAHKGDCTSSPLSLEKEVTRRYGFMGTCHV